MLKSINENNFTGKHHKNGWNFMFYDFYFQQNKIITNYFGFCCYFRYFSLIFFFGEFSWSC